MLREKADSGPESGSRVMMMCKRHKSTLTPGAKLEPTAAAAAALLQSCPTLCDPTDGSSPGSSVPGGIFIFNVVLKIKVILHNI